MSGSATARAERIADFLLRHPDADRRDVEDSIKRRAGSPLPEIPVDFVDVIVGGKGEFDRFFNGKADLAHVRAWEAKVEAEPVKRRMPLDVWIKAGKDLSPEGASATWPGIWTPAATGEAAPGPTDPRSTSAGEKPPGDRAQGRPFVAYVRGQGATARSGRGGGAWARGAAEAHPAAVHHHAAPGVFTEPSTT